MAQTPLDYNELMFGYNGQPFEFKNTTIITAAGTLLKGTVLVPSGLGFDPPADAAAVEGWAVLLEDVDTTGGNVAAKVGKTGGVFKDKLVFAGALAAYTDQVGQKFAMNNIFVINGTNAMAIAGEGA